jgi:hypothetical protein
MARREVYYWNTLSAGGQAQQCGWLKDKFGLSWQTVPAVLGQLLQDKDPQKSKRMMEAMLADGQARHSASQGSLRGAIVPGGKASRSAAAATCGSRRLASREVA